MLGASTIFQCSLTPGFPSVQASYVNTIGLRVYISGGTISAANNNLITISSQYLGLLPSTATYIFVNLTTGNIQFNNTGFATSGIYPIAIVLTTGSEVYSISDQRPDVFGGGSGGGTGPPGGTFGFTSVVFSSSPTFVPVATSSTCFEIILSGNVVSSAFTTTGLGAGNLFTWIIIQDVTGGHTFTWPIQVPIIPTIGNQPGQTTVVSFMWDGVFLQPMGTPTVYP